MYWLNTFFKLLFEPFSSRFISFLIWSGSGGAVLVSAISHNVWMALVLKSSERLCRVIRSSSSVPKVWPRSSSLLYWILNFSVNFWTSGGSFSSGDR